MPETLLRTKLFAPPPRPNVVPRPRLLDRLNLGLQLGHRLSLISAPAGFGKTTVAGEWVERLRVNDERRSQLDSRIAWLSLDENDNDLVRFLAYLVAALSQVEGVERPIGKGALGMLESPQPPPPEPVLTSLINDIAGVSGRIVLVFDDYHLVDAAPVDAALTYLLENLPPQLHVVVATRIDPNLPLARLRARGQLTELRAADLRFTSAEAAAFLNQVMGLDLNQDAVATLESRTEGWIAGLQLAALALRGSPSDTSARRQDDVASFVASFSGSHRYVLDYLIEDVLEQQSMPIQRFLQQTAILDRLNGTLCDAVRFGAAGAPAGEESAQVILEALEHANLFLVPLDEERRWYRYHHLFSELLRRRLQQTQPEIMPVLHIRAAKWLRQQGLFREAIKHSLAAHDYQGAAALIGAIAIDVMQQGEHTTVVSWINALPGDLVEKEPYLCVLHAWALQLTGQLETAEARLLNAEDALDDLKQQMEEDANTIRGLIHSHRAYVTFMRGEHDKTIDYAHQALDQLPEAADLIRAQTALYLGVAYRYQGQFQAAFDIYKETLPFARKMGGKSIAVLCYLHLGDLHRQTANLFEAHALYEEALHTTERHTGRADLPFCGYAYVSIGRILRQWNQLEDAYRATTKGLALCRDWNVADILALSYIELAYTQQALGRNEDARASMQEATKIMADFSAWGVKYVAAHQVRMDLMRGDMEAVAHWLQGSDLDVAAEFQFHREGEYLALARVLMAQKRFEEAHALVRRIYGIAQKSGKRRTELEGLILLASLFSIQGDMNRALGPLQKALSMSEPEGFVRIFVDEGPPMAHLLGVALNRGLAPPYVRRLLSAFPTDETSRAVNATIQPEQSGLIEPLSERELEVLHLVSEGLTNRQIAERLYLSLNTIKVHNRNIYGKLGVNNRVQAVARARELSLLPPP